MKTYAAVLMCAVAAAASAQTTSKYPNVNRPFAVAPGDTVQLLSRILVDRSPGARGARIDILYATRIPESNEQERLAQADRLAQLVGSEALRAGIRRVTVAICETRACAETREQPRTWFAYERGMAGVWQRLPKD